MSAILFGLLAALGWGGADFTGGLASRRMGALHAVLFSELAGFVLLLAALSIYRDPFLSPRSLLSAFSAGAIGTLGLLTLYQAMTTGKMSIAAPVSALLAAALPVLYNSLTEGLPKLTQLVGFALALASIWLVTQAEGETHPHLEHLSDLRLPFLSGIGFGVYFILMHRVAQEATLWPMVASRSGGMLLLGLALLVVQRQPLRIERADWRIVAFSGALDVTGNLFFILASQSGRVDLAAVLSSLFPGVTVLLAWLVLKEQLSNSQRLGILVSLLAIGLMTI